MLSKKTILGWLVFLVATPALAQMTDDYGTGATSGSYCPSLSMTMYRGMKDANTLGQVSELQKFLADYFDIDPSEIVTGFFGRITQNYLMKFQKEKGLPVYGIAGTLTRGVIAKECSNSTQSNQVNQTQPISISPTLPTTIPTTPINPSETTVVAPSVLPRSIKVVSVNLPMITIAYNNLPQSEIDIINSTDGTHVFNQTLPSTGNGTTTIYFSKTNPTPPNGYYYIRALEMGNGGGMVARTTSFLIKDTTPVNSSSLLPMSVNITNPLKATAYRQFTVSGTALNADSFSLEVIYPTGDIVQRNITPMNGKWDTIHEGFPAGSYKVIARANNTGASILSEGVLTVTPSEYTAIAPVCNITVTPSTVSALGQAVVSWKSTNATSANIDKAFGPVSLEGSQSTSFENKYSNYDITYNMTVSGAGGTNNCSTVVHVTSPGLPSASITDSPTSLKSISGPKFTISGVAKNTNNVFTAIVNSSYSGATDWPTIYANKSYVAYTGLNPSSVMAGNWTAVYDSVAPGSYKVFVYDSSASDSRKLLTSADLVVNPVSAKTPTISLTASPATISLPSQSSKVSWSATDATSCTLKYGSTVEKDLPVSGYKMVSPIRDTEYIIGCTNTLSGSTPTTASKSVIVKSTVYSAPIVSSVSPNPVESGGNFVVVGKFMGSRTDKTVKTQITVLKGGNPVAIGASTLYLFASTVSADFTQATFNFDPRIAAKYGYGAYQIVVEVPGTEGGAATYNISVVAPTPVTTTVDASGWYSY
jgi:hypothetical protein